MPAEAHVMTNHKDIRQWAEERGGTPATIKNTKKTQEPSICIHLPNEDQDASLIEISWEAWFEIFDRENLALICREETAFGEASHFYQIVNRSDYTSTSNENV